MECGMEGCDRKAQYPNLQLCDPCYRKVRRAEAAERSGNPSHRPAKWSARDLEYAKMLLEDGASYRETSRSSCVPRTTLREKLPGHGWTLEEGGEFALGFMRTPKLYTMQKEIGLLKDGD